MTTATEQETITLNYNLYDLPTAQHKAGLAGLLFLIQTLMKRNVSPLPEIIEKTPISVKIIFSETSLQTLFKEIYAACLVESTSKQVRKDKNKQIIEPLRIEERLSADGKKNEKIYIYQDVRPRGRFFADYFSGGEESPWLKLWQDMLWGTLRAIPATRGIYEEQLENKTCTEAGKVWAQLLKTTKPKNQSLTNAVASSIYIGAQNVNAEQVPFMGLIAQNLLLHFWSLVSLVYVPQRFSIEEERIKFEYAGFVLAIPEVSHLEDFLETYIPLIQNLTLEKWGYRPKDALITFPDEAGMEYLFQLTHAGFLEAKGKKLKRVVNSIELHHLEKQGKVTRILTTDKVVPNSRWFNKYENVRKKIHNPYFKSLYLKNILMDSLWYQGFNRALNIYSWKLFIYNPTKPMFNFFGVDAKNCFKILIEDLEKKERSKIQMPELANDQLARSVYRLIRGYAQFKSESKSGVQYESIKDSIKTQGYPKAYREAREKVCSDAFLAMRGRREADFIEYFTGTICSVPHFLPEDEFIQVGHALLHDWETVKTLSMLALSAHSYLTSPKKETEGEAQ